MSAISTASTWECGRPSSPKHATLNQIFAGMLPFMGIQVVAIVLLYVWPQIGMWLPQVLYGR